MTTFAYDESTQSNKVHILTNPNWEKEINLHHRIEYPKGQQRDDFLTLLETEAGLSTEYGIFTIDEDEFPNGTLHTYELPFGRIGHMLKPKMYNEIHNALMVLNGAMRPVGTLNVVVSMTIADYEYASDLNDMTLCEVEIEPIGPRSHPLMA